MMEKEEFGKVDHFRKIPEARNWGWFLALGVLLIIIGIIAIGYSGWTTLFSVIFLGAALVIAGVVQIINGFQARKWTGISLSLLLGILYIVTGVLCLTRPLGSALGITLLLAAFFLVGGLFRIISASMLRFEHWAWILFSGIIAFILGILIISEWPVSGIWLIGLFVGIDILLAGLSWTFLALSARKEAK